MDRIEKNLKLVHAVANNYYSPRTCEIDDLIQVGCIGLIKADRSFKEGKNVQFSTYATSCIRNEIISLLRKEKLVSSVKTTPLENQLHLREKNTNVETKIVIDEVIKELERDEFYQVVRLYANGMKQKEIALFFGENTSSLCKKIKAFRLRYKQFHPSELVNE